MLWYWKKVFLRGSNYSLWFFAVWEGSNWELIFDILILHLYTSRTSWNFDHANSHFTPLDRRYNNIIRDLKHTMKRSRCMFWRAECVIMWNVILQSISILLNDSSESQASIFETRNVTISLRRLHKIIQKSIWESLIFFRSRKVHLFANQRWSLMYLSEILVLLTNPFLNVLN